MIDLPEPEVLIGRRAFAEAQALFDGERIAVVGRVAVGWHDTAVQPETGSFAVVRVGGPHTGLLGEVIRVTRGDRSVLAYVLGSAGVPTDISLARRAFFALGLLASESLDCSVEVVA